MSLETLRWVKFPVLNDGFVTLVDAMGTDASIIQAARVSYNKDVRSEDAPDDEKLLRFLMRHGHTTPFEMCELKVLIRIPMDAWRQMIRHRTACLSGDTRLHFDLPGRFEKAGAGLYKLTVKEVFDKFQPTKNANPKRQKNAYFKKDRVQGMLLRNVDEATMEISYTHITDIWESGVKPVYRVSTAKSSLKMSQDHLCLTDRGWLKLREIVDLQTCSISNTTPKLASIGPGYDTGVMPVPNEIDVEDEEWSPILDWEDWYEVSTYGRVKRVIGGRGSATFGRCKTITVSNGRAVVSLNRPGQQITAHVHVLMAEAFLGVPEEKGLEVCHNDGNSLNNVIDNLRWDCAKSNANDRVRDDATTRLKCNFEPIVSCELVGEEMTYDLEVEGPYHNFSAEGVVVHNSVNEYSTRYTTAIDSKATTQPEDWRLQAKSNKQGSEGFLEDWTEEAKLNNSNLAYPYETPNEYLSAKEQALHNFAQSVYDERVSMGIALEQARKDLPLSTYTEAYWKIDLHNLLHFLEKRLDPTAQLEIRLYAKALAEITKDLWPQAFKAFEDYRLKSIKLSALDIEVIRQITTLTGAELLTPQERVEEIIKDKRERSECLAKLTRLGFISE